MHINFAMWRKAAWELIKMDNKKEWDALDVISKWLIATRSAVTTVTIYSSIIAGLLAWRDGHFSFLPWLIVTLGLFIAHGTNNLLNDYTDFSRGIDKDNYFRTQYGVHPLVQGFWTKSQQIQWFLISGVIAFLSGVYALFYTHANPVVIGLFALGSLILLFYTWPMKYWALGELAIFLIWGPIMIAGVYLVLSGVWNWNVALAGIPFGLSVASINVAKHTDKLQDDKKKGVGTFPVRVGQTFARYTTMATIVIAYAVVIYLVASGYFSTFMLLILFAGQRAFYAIAVLTKPRPEGPPAGFEAFWPTWFSGFAFYHNRLFGGLFILGVLLDTIAHIFKAQLPLSANWLGLIALGIGMLIAAYRFAMDQAKKKK
jgi:1,4-dihydroxy-2-naphthoate polyprenyltransferase